MFVGLTRGRTGAGIGLPVKLAAGGPSRNTRTHAGQRRPVSGDHRIRHGGKVGGTGFPSKRMPTTICAGEYISCGQWGRSRGSRPPIRCGEKRTRSPGADPKRGNLHRRGLPGNQPSLLFGTRRSWARSKRSNRERNRRRLTGLRAGDVHPVRHPKSRGRCVLHDPRISNNQGLIRATAPPLTSWGRFGIHPKARPSRASVREY
jgi:hypothetical protein